MGKDKRTTLLDLPEWWEEHWQGMPKFIQEDRTPFKSILVNFKDQKDVDAFMQHIEQKFTIDTKSIWHPKSKISKISHLRWINNYEHTIKYPIYIISKGRWESRSTSKTLEELKLPYHIVIEPQEYEQYAEVIDPNKILVLPFSNLGEGSIPARNWVWEHAVALGVKRHWLMDDNIYSFWRLNKNSHIRVNDGTILKVIEDFTDRYENIAFSGPENLAFVRKNEKCPPLKFNTRVYSCTLIKNDLPYRWRGRYNEDTDLILRALKDGWCTILFYAFTMDKATTMIMKGGNTDELYVQDEQFDGRLEMAKSLEKQHPDVTKVTWKWGRWQHHVDYRIFRWNKLIKKSNITIPKGVNNYGMELVNIKERDL